MGDALVQDRCGGRGDEHSEEEPGGVGGGFDHGSDGVGSGGIPGGLFGGAQRPSIGADGFLMIGGAAVAACDAGGGEGGDAEDGGIHDAPFASAASPNPGSLGRVSGRMQEFHGGWGWGGTQRRNARDVRDVSGDQGGNDSHGGTKEWSGVVRDRPTGRQLRASASLRDPFSGRDGTGRVSRGDEENAEEEGEGWGTVRI